MRGMVVGEGGRSSGVLLYYLHHWIAILMQQNDNEPELPQISDYLYSGIFILLNFGYTVCNFLPISNLHPRWNELQ